MQIRYEEILVDGCGCGRLPVRRAAAAREILEAQLDTSLVPFCKLLVTRTVLNVRVAGAVERRRARSLADQLATRLFVSAQHSRQ